MFAMGVSNNFLAVNFLAMDRADCQNIIVIRIKYYAKKHL